MRAIQYTRTGPPEVLSLVELPVPDPGPGEVRVRIVVSGVNPTDWKSRAGSGDGAALPVPQVPGQDGAGLVDAVGPGVRELSPGQRVWLWDAAWNRPGGTTEELVVLPAEHVVPLPDDESFDTGASLGIPALTAHRTLTAREDGPSRLSPGSLEGVTVLIPGGAGAVGHAAIQLARWAGARVITTVSSPQKGALARAAGAHEVVDYRSEDAEARIREFAPAGVEMIIEVNARANLALDIASIAPSGTVAIYAGEPAGSVEIPTRPSMSKNIRYQFVLTYTTTEEQKRNAVAAVSEALSDGALRVGEASGLPIHRFPIEQAADAHRAVENGAVGKVLIDIGEGAPEL
jgi:NADPH2:quinone reductase